jgi:hypothetical protein
VFNAAQFPKLASHVTTPGARDEREIVKVPVLFSAKFIANLSGSRCTFVYSLFHFLPHLSENIWKSRASDSSLQIVRDGNFNGRSHTQLVGEIVAEVRLQIELANLASLLLKVTLLYEDVWRSGCTDHVLLTSTSVEDCW